MSDRPPLPAVVEPITADHGLGQGPVFGTSAVPQANTATLPDPLVKVIRSLRHGCYVARWTPTTATSGDHYDGTLRVERSGTGTIASGDLYHHAPSGSPLGSSRPEPDPTAGVPIFPVKASPRLRGAKVYDCGRRGSLALRPYDPFVHKTSQVFDRRTGGTTMQEFRNIILVLVVGLAATVLAMGQQEPPIGPSPEDVVGLEEVMDRFREEDPGVSLRIVAVPVVHRIDVNDIGVHNAASMAAENAIKAALRQDIAARRVGETRFIVFEAMEDQFIRLIADRLLIFVEVEKLFAPGLSVALPSVRADEMHNDGARGRGSVVAIIDSGVDVDHPFLTALRVVREACFSRNNCSSGTMDYAQGAGRNCDPSITSDCEHGTHVAGIALSSDSQLSGMAPDAQYIPIQASSVSYDPKICDPKGAGKPTPCVRFRGTDLAEALDWIKKQTHTYPIAAVNMSLGGGKYQECQYDSLAPTIRQLRQEGTAVVVVAGNDHWSNDVWSPGCIPSAVTVGATRSSGSTGVIADFSNLAPVVDLLAPGSGIESAVPNGGTAQYSGTSMAAPMISGAIAALRHYTDDLEKIEQVLKDTGTSRTRPNTSLHKPEIDLGAAIRELDKEIPEGDFVWMADTWNDTGGEPDPATERKSMSQSPFVWVRQDVDCAGHPHEHRNPEYGIQNFICVMINNSGKGLARGTIQVYIAQSNLSRTGSWTLIAEQGVEIPPRSEVIPTPIPWDTVPAPGHYCLLVRWFPEGGSSSLRLPDGITAAVRNSNDLIWKNVTIVDATRYRKPMKFYIEEDSGMVNLVVDVRHLAPGELEDFGFMGLSIDADENTIAAIENEPTYQRGYYNTECSSTECLILIPLKSGVSYLPNVVVSVDGEYEVTFWPDYDEIANLKERRLHNTVLVEIMNIEDIAAHKRGEAEIGPAILYEIPIEADS